MPVARDVFSQDGKALLPLIFLIRFSPGLIDCRLNFSVRNWGAGARLPPFLLSRYPTLCDLDQQERAEQNGTFFGQAQSQPFQLNTDNMGNMGTWAECA